jgi:hypothetical protein
MLANGTCAACHPSGRSCTDPSHLSCTACYSSASLNPSPIGQCICSSSTYLDLSSFPPSCQPCHSSCLKCSGPSSSNCSVCGSGATLTDTGTCLCQSGYTFSTSGPACTAIPDCPAVCAGSCLSTAPPKCLACISTGILLSDFGCTCPSGSFLSVATTSTPSCTACSPKCSECQANPTNSPSSCVQCKSPGIYPSVMDSENNDCLTDTPGTFFDETTKTTMNCTGSARTCTGSLKFASCFPDTELSNNNSTCNCPIYTTYSIAQKACVASTPLSLCIYPRGTTCDLCDSYSFNEYQQICTCKARFALSNGVCVPYPPDCGDTADNATCSSCPPNTSLFNGRCLCGPGTYMDPLTETCQKCFFLCATCENYSTTSCLTCRSPSSTIPKCDCPSGYYANNSTLLTNPCIACHASCLTCKGDQPTDCLTCKLGARITPNGTCTCPLGKYMSQSTFDCLPCDSNSNYLECSIASNNCTVCKNNLSPPDCTCPTPLSNYYSSSSTSGFCFSCWAPETTSCTLRNSGLFAAKSCNSPLILNNVSECVCGNGYYYDGSTCATCDALCSTCFGAGKDKCLTISASVPQLLLHPQLKVIYAQEGYEHTTTNPYNVACNTLTLRCSLVNPQNIPLKCAEGADIASSGLCECKYQYKQVTGRNYCEPCHWTCDSCTAPFIDNGCDWCLNQLMVMNVGGVCKCLNGDPRDPITGLCPKSCPPDCYKCSTSTTCSDCYDQATVVNGRCVCNSGYGFNSHYKCVSCDKNCSTCDPKNYTQCTSCRIPDQIPPSCKCPTGRYFDNIEQFCMPCHVRCKECFGTGVNHCSSCNYTGILPIGGLCGCPTGMFWNSSNQCQNCAPMCKECLSSSTKCIECRPGATLSNGRCLCPGPMLSIPSGCPPPYNGSCNLSCLTCSGSTENDCLSCNINSYFFEGKCLCLGSKFMNTSLGTCQNCNGCAKCSYFSGDICTSCGDGAFLNVTTSKCQCLPNFSGLSSTGGCSTPFTCADKGCAACTDSTPTSPCLICKSQYAILNNSKCTCPQGMYRDSVGLCQYCLPTCYGCTNNTECSECLPPAKLNTTSKLCTCNSSQFINPAGYCLDCHQSCLTCTALHNRGCTTCKPPAVLQPEGWCKCPQYTVMNETTFNCDPVCHFTCGTCNGPLNTNCLTCKAGGAVYNSSTKTCDCTPGNYRTITGTCEPCHINCLTCTGPGPTECLSCKTLAVLSGKGSCVCGANKVRKSSGECETITCHKSCVSCNGTSDTSCLSCRPQANLSPSGACVCQSTYYPDSNYGCQPCHTRCYTCSGPLATECTSCASGKYLFPNNSCECPAGQAYADATTTLCSSVTCHISCKTCDGVFDNNCLSCKVGAVLDVYKRCICPASTYRATTTGECQPCLPPCLSCTGPLLSDCFTCKTNAMELAIGTSKSCTCKLGYYSDSTALKCSPCHKKCIGCDGPNENQCTMCIQATTPSNGICLPGANLQLTTEGLIRPISPPACHNTCKQCQSGSTGQYNQCTACWNKAELQSDNSCLCNQGYKLDPNG